MIDPLERLSSILEKQKQFLETLSSWNSALINARYFPNTDPKLLDRQTIKNQKISELYDNYDNEILSYLKRLHDDPFTNIFDFRLVKMESEIDSLIDEINALRKEL